VIAYERLYRYVPVVLGRRPALQEPVVEEWRRHYPLFPRILFVLDGTGPGGVENRISALRAGAGLLTPSRFLHDVPVLVAPLADLLHHGASAPVWRPAHDPGRRVGWMNPVTGGPDAQPPRIRHGAALRFPRHCAPNLRLPVAGYGRGPHLGERITRRRTHRSRP
jgi:hypothetical protein